VDFLIRDYRPEDFLALWQLDQSCFPPGIAYSQLELRCYIRRPRAFAMLAESRTANLNSAILGFVVAEENRGIGHIITLDVGAAARRHGIASALLGAAETRLCKEKCHTMRLETSVENFTALRFYKHHGYDVIKTIPRYYSDGVDALLLQKNLLSPIAPAKLLK
jgi:ribosomal-protein-alanine N-acetyltransferase